MRSNAIEFGTQFYLKGRGWCDKTTNKVVGQLGLKPRRAVSQAQCVEFALKHGGKAYTWRTRPHRGTQECTVLADYCKLGRQKGGRHVHSYSLQEEMAMWQLVATENPSKFKIQNQYGGCLKPDSTKMYNCADTGPLEVSQACTNDAQLKNEEGKCLSHDVRSFLFTYRPCDPTDLQQKFEIAAA
jgi:hypothetical protein